MDVEDWLDGLGLGQYKATFAENDIDAAVLRLTAPDQMGEVFKVMAVAAATLAPTAGFPPSASHGAL